VQVAAVLADSWGIHAWGWNSVGSGFGEHAEAHCIKRANRQRISQSTLYVAAKRKKNNKPVLAKPCRECERVAIKCKKVVFRTKENVWV
jgi:deoxycytidylate deaminase